jgi:sulfopyruvate decarboxylase subunit beta
MTRLEAIKLVIDMLEGDELVIHANGAISRESFFCHNREENFSLLGSMGLASSVALGELYIIRNEKSLSLMEMEIS